MDVNHIQNDIKAVGGEKHVIWFHEITTGPHFEFNL